jgi:hypothetical protein
MKRRTPRLARRPTRQEYREQVALTRSLLAQGLPKANIKRALRQRYGDLSPRTVERYVGRARAVRPTLAGEPRARRAHHDPPTVPPGPAPDRPAKGWAGNDMRPSVSRAPTRASNNVAVRCPPGGHGYVARAPARVPFS